MPIELSVAALFYNEEEAAESVVRNVHAVMTREGLAFEIVAVDNGSRDRTPDILKRLSSEFPQLRIVTVAVNQGAGYGAIQGLYAGIGDVIVGIPGDGQVDPEAIPPLLRVMRLESADIAHGLRRNRPDGWQRWLVSKAYNLLMAVLFGVPAGDMNGPPKLLRRDALNALKLCSADHFLDCEMMLKARRMGMRVATMPVEFLPRAGGTSTIRFKDCLTYLHHLIVIRVCREDPWGINAIPKQTATTYLATRSTRAQVRG